MICQFDPCEFYNLFFGGIITGIVASFLYILIEKAIKHIKFNRQFKHLVSIDQFDWNAYSMRKDDGRKREENSNGTKLHLKIVKGQIHLEVNEVNRGFWDGILRMESSEFGTITYKYQKDYEFGFGNCVLGSFKENGKTFDYIFFVRTTNRIYELEKTNDLKLGVKYNYGDELFLRERASV